jgi:hypothetical protein
MNITFELEGVEYELPEFLNIENYVKIYKIKDMMSDEYFHAKLINQLTGAPMEQLLDVSHEKIKYLVSHLGFLVPTKPLFHDQFEIDGVKYGFIPKWEGMSFAEFVDLDTLFSKKPEEILDYIHVLCAIMYRPIVGKHKGHDFKIEKYNSDTVEERAKLFKTKLDIKYFIGAQFFFIKFAKKFSERSQSSSITTRVWTTLKTYWRYRRIIWRILSKKDLGGTLLSTELPKTTSPNTTQSSTKV